MKKNVLKPKYPWSPEVANYSREEVMAMFKPNPSFYGVADNGEISVPEYFSNKLYSLVIEGQKALSIYERVVSMQSLPVSIGPTTVAGHLIVKLEIQLKVFWAHLESFRDEGKHGMLAARLLYDSIDQSAYINFRKTIVLYESHLNNLLIFVGNVSA